MCQCSRLQNCVSRKIIFFGSFYSQSPPPLEEKTTQAARSAIYDVMHTSKRGVSPSSKRGVYRWLRGHNLWRGPRSPLVKKTDLLVKSDWSEKVTSSPPRGPSSSGPLWRSSCRSSRPEWLRRQPRASSPALAPLRGPLSGTLEAWQWGCWRAAFA